MDFARAESLKIKLGEGIADSTSPWYNLLSGFSVLKSSPDSIPIYFGRALESAGNDMGTVYVLSLEFDRFQQQLWEQKCLERARKLFLSSGAQSSPLISQSLLISRRCPLKKTAIMLPHLFTITGQCYLTAKCSGRQSGKYSRLFLSICQQFIMNVAASSQPLPTPGQASFHPCLSSSSGSANASYSWL